MKKDLQLAKFTSKGNMFKVPELKFLHRNNNVKHNKVSKSDSSRYLDQQRFNTLNNSQIVQKQFNRNLKIEVGVGGDYDDSQQETFDLRQTFQQLHSNTQEIDMPQVSLSGYGQNDKAIVDQVGTMQLHNNNQEFNTITYGPTHNNYNGGLDNTSAFHNHTQAEYQQYKMSEGIIQDNSMQPTTEDISQQIDNLQYPTQEIRPSANESLELTSPEPHTQKRSIFSKPKMRNSYTNSKMWKKGQPAHLQLVESNDLSEDEYTENFDPQIQFSNQVIAEMDEDLYNPYLNAMGPRRIQEMPGNDCRAPAELGAPAMKVNDPTRNIQYVTQSKDTYEGDEFIPNQDQDNEFDHLLSYELAVLMLNQRHGKANQRYFQNDKSLNAQLQLHDFSTYDMAQPETSPQNNIHIVESNVQSQQNTIQIVESNVTQVPAEPEPESGTGIPKVAETTADPGISADLQANIDVTIEPEFTIEPQAELDVTDATMEPEMTVEPENTNESMPKIQQQSGENSCFALPSTLSLESSLLSHQFNGLRKISLPKRLRNYSITKIPSVSDLHHLNYVDASQEYSISENDNRTDEAFTNNAGSRKQISNNNNSRKQMSIGNSNKQFSADNNGKKVGDAALLEQHDQYGNINILAFNQQSNSSTSLTKDNSYVRLNNRRGSDGPLIKKLNLSKVIRNQPLNNIQEHQQEYSASNAVQVDPKNQTLNIPSLTEFINHNEVPQDYDCTQEYSIHENNERRYNQIHQIPYAEQTQPLQHSNYQEAMFKDHRFNPTGKIRHNSIDIDQAGSTLTLKKTSQKAFKRSSQQFLVQNKKLLDRWHNWRNFSNLQKYQEKAGEFQKEDSIHQRRHSEQDEIEKMYGTDYCKDRLNSGSVSNSCIKFQKGNADIEELVAPRIGRPDNQLMISSTSQNWNSVNRLNMYHKVEMNKMKQSLKKFRELNVAKESDLMLATIHSSNDLSNVATSKLSTSQNKKYNTIIQKNQSQYGKLQRNREIIQQNSRQLSLSPKQTSDQAAKFESANQTNGQGIKSPNSFKQKVTNSITHIRKPQRSEISLQINKIKARNSQLPLVLPINRHDDMKKQSEASISMNTMKTDLKSQQRSVYHKKSKRQLHEQFNKQSRQGKFRKQNDPTIKAYGNEQENLECNKGATQDNFHNEVQSKTSKFVQQRKMMRESRRQSEQLSNGQKLSAMNSTNALNMTKVVEQILNNQASKSGIS